MRYSCFLWNQSCSCSGSGCCGLHPCGRHSSFLELSAPTWQTQLLGVVCAYMADTAACSCLHLRGRHCSFLQTVCFVCYLFLLNSKATPWPTPRLTVAFPGHFLGGPYSCSQELLLPTASTACYPTPAPLPAQSIAQPGDRLGPSLRTVNKAEERWGTSRLHNLLPGYLYCLLHMRYAETLFLQYSKIIHCFPVRSNFPNNYHCAALHVLAAFWLLSCLHLFLACTVKNYP
jgi:hypothetical protein